MDPSTRSSNTGNRALRLWSLLPFLSVVLCTSKGAGCARLAAGCNNLSHSPWVSNTPAFFGCTPTTTRTTSSAHQLNEPQRSTPTGNNLAAAATLPHKAAPATQKFHLAPVHKPEAIPPNKTLRHSLSVAAEQGPSLLQEEETPPAPHAHSTQRQQEQREILY